MVGSARSANFGKTLEYAHHALSVLREEGPGLLDHSFVVESPGKCCRDNNSENRVEEIVVFPKSIGVIDVCRC